MLNLRAAQHADPRQAEKGQHSAAVYIAPLKALARERLKDWKAKLGGGLGLTVVELTGDVTPDANALRCARVPKWKTTALFQRRRSISTTKK